MPDIDGDEDDLDMRWPTAGDRAFVPAPPAFGAWTADDVKERLWRMIRGYRRAADLLVTQAESDASLRRDLVYPIVFSYRHSLELALKQVLEEHGPGVGKAPEFRKHQLGEIWPRCREVIEHFNPGADPAPLEVLALLVDEFSQIDPGSFSFRYASDTKGKALDLKVSCIDLSELRAVMAGIHNFLECVDLQISSIDYGDG
jgi:hypothetical protein